MREQNINGPSFVSFYPPTVVNNFIIADGIYEKCSSTIKLEDILHRWIPKYPKPNIIENKEYKVLSSNGKEYYTVKSLNGDYTCTCIGYSFRRYCKHITKIKEENGSKH